MSAKGTTKSKTTVVDTTVDERMQAAENWWYNMISTEQEPFRDKFKSAYAPTNEEILAAYVGTHEDSGVAKPATPEVARAWWNSLYPEDRKALRDKIIDAPSDEEVMQAYDEMHKTKLGVEAQHTGEEPPVSQPATPWASATNPALMANDAVAGEGTALFAQSPIPGGYVPPPPPEPLP